MVVQILPIMENNRQPPRLQAGVRQILEPQPLVSGFTSMHVDAELDCYLN